MQHETEVVVLLALVLLYLGNVTLCYSKLPRVGIVV